MVWGFLVIRLLKYALTDLNPLRDMLVSHETIPSSQAVVCLPSVAILIPRICFVDLYGSRKSWSLLLVHPSNVLSPNSIPRLSVHTSRDLNKLTIAPLCHLCYSVSSFSPSHVSVPLTLSQFLGNKVCPSLFFHLSCASSRDCRLYWFPSCGLGIVSFNRQSCQPSSVQPFPG